MNKKVSFVLAIYNAERTLEECLNSILMQNYSKNKYEIIIVDGGSTDKTLKIINKFRKKTSNIKLIHNPKKLSEGKGMGKSQGINASKGEFLVLLDHDNIITSKDWLKNMLFPFNDYSIMASQSLLQYKEEDSNFIKYINALGVEDAFAVPYSLVAQVSLYPAKFKLIKNKYYVHKLNKNKILFGGANGCIFRKKVFKKIDYTRDVNVFTEMAEQSMIVAVVKNVKIHHKTSSDFLSFLKKKAIYFYRFISQGYKESTFRWVGKSFSGKVKFYLTVLSNLTLIGPGILGLKQSIKTGKLFWLLHPFYVFYMTLLYGIITLFKIKDYFKYSG